MATLDDLILLWGGDPTDDERAAFDDFCRAFLQDDGGLDSYHATGDVSALSTCTTKGTNTPTGYQTFVRVAADTDDGHWTDQLGSTLDSTNTGFGGGWVVYAENVKLPKSETISAQSQFAVNGFFRFVNVAVPQGAVINYAKLHWLISEQDSGTDNEITLTVEAEDSTNSSSAITSKTDYQNRTTTTNKRTWLATEEFDALDVDSTLDSPNIACVVQEIIDKPGWVSGNAMQLFVIGSDQDAKVYNPYDYYDDADKAAQLQIFYSLCIAETGSGGVRCGGSSEQSSGISESGSGGAVCGGVAEITSVWKLYGSGGASLSGVALVNASIGTSGGAVGGGSATPWLGYIMQGGAVCGGAALVSRHTSQSVSGGVVVGRATNYGNGFSYRVAIVVPEGATDHDLDKYFLRISVELDPDHVLTGTDFQVEEDDVVAPHYLINYDATTGRVHLVAKVQTLPRSGKTYYLYFGKEV